jgi:glycosyltransferase involved in cell wall biosynthesis
MKLSIIIPVLNSHEILRRQILHFEKMGIPKDTEIIIVDDGSTPPIEINSTLPITLHHSNDFREWTWPVARNTGAKLAKGEYFLMVDLDHIITKEIIDTVRSFTGDFVRFNRQFAVLDENGNLTQDRATLEAYGLPKDRDVKFTPHRNQFAIHRNLYKKMGGFREDRIGMPYPQREDGDFAKLWRQLYEKGEVRDFDDLIGYDKRETLYMFPNGKYCGDVDHNPFGLFHNLSRKTEKNRFYTRTL